MNSSTIEIDSETSRIRSALVNSGKFSFSEAERSILNSTLSISIGQKAAVSPAGQSAFLTAVATGVRCFGNVSIEGHIEEPLLLNLPINASNLLEAAHFLGAQQEKTVSPGFTIGIGDAAVSEASWSVQAFWDAWNFGAAPGKRPMPIGDGECVLAGVAAGGLAVGQAFLRAQGDLRAGSEIYSLNLWTPDARSESSTPHPPTMAELYLPTHIWIVGLGNLGQALLWSLTMLPYPDPSCVNLMLQDDDIVKRENWGTSILVEKGCYGELKTYLAEKWAKQRGFNVRRMDRKVDNQLTRMNSEPNLAFAGLDRISARRLLGNVGFDYILDAGLGSTHSEYRKFRINVFDKDLNPTTHFAGIDDNTKAIADELLKLNAYRELTGIRNDGGCGAATLAETSVAVPFVSAIVGAMTVTQAIRIASHQYPYRTITGDTGDLNTIRATPANKSERLIVNNIKAAGGFAQSADR